MRSTGTEAPILVVDDNAATRALVVTGLRRADFDVVEAASGEAALGLIEGEAIGLVVLDLSMPGMSGIDVVRALRERPQTATLPVILLTGRGDEYPLVSGLGAGADDYLTKPVRLDDLVARIRARLRSERVAGEQALRHSEELYRTLVEQSADGILVSDRSGRYVEANQAICRMLGYSRDELLAMFTPSLSAADDPLSPVDMDERLAETAAGTGLLVERRYRRKDGTSLPAEVGFSQLPDGRLQRNIRDISARLTAEAVLHESERNLAEAQRISNIGSWEWDLTTDTAQRSEELYRILGVQPGAIAGTNEAFLAFVHSDDRARVQASERAVISGSGRHDLDYRIVRPDGTIRIVHEEAEVICDEHGAPVRMVGTVQDVTAQRSAQDALIASELRYATIFEGTAESILIAEVATMRIRWVNSAACALLGYTQDELIELTVHDIHPAADLPAVLDQFQALVDGRITVARSVPCRRKDGTTLLADIKGSSAVVDGVTCSIGFFTDVTELHRLEVQDRKLAQAIDQASEAILITGPTAEIEYVNPAFERLSGFRLDELVGGMTSVLGSPQSKATSEAMWRTVSAGESWVGDLVHRRPDGTERVAMASISPVHDADGTVTAFVDLEHDVTDERALAVERERLVAAVEQTSDSVIIADLAGTIEYVNPAFERVSGYRREEVIGQNPRMLKSDRQSAAFYRALWRRLTRGKTWTGTLINRRKDGSLYEEVATISPMRSPGGETTGYVAVKRDVTALRAAESGLAREFRERAEVAAALARLQPVGGADATAAEICDELLGLPGIDAAAIVYFLDPRRAVPLAVRGPDGLPAAPGRLLPAARARYLYERAGQGPWAEAWRPRRADGRYGQTVAESGILAVAYAPIRNAEGLLGVVAAGTRDEAYARHMIEHLPAVGEFAATASVLLSGLLGRGRRNELVRERVQRALAEGGLTLVFQPIVALASGEPVGYEALTRFADGTPPDRMIAEAHSVGLGLELEIACLAAALDAAEALPQDAWLSLNASPDVILHSTELAALLADRSRRFVLEITEHAKIDDYAAVRAAVVALGPTVSLAVDDAGSGFASIRHIVELLPRFLKLDISLVRHVDRDLARQAMIAGLTQFAARVGSEVIAEGIENPAELEMLRELGVPLGQGYLLGRPEAVSRTTDEA